MSWSVYDDLCGSDHFPIIVQYDQSSIEERIPKWNFKKADWDTFNTLCQEQLADPIFENDINPMKTFTDTLISIADSTVPKTLAVPSKPHLPWNDQECKEAVKTRKKAERKFNRQPTLENVSNVRIFRAKARRTINQNRKNCWKDYVSKLNSRTPLSKVWNMVKKI